VKRSFFLFAVLFVVFSFWTFNLSARYSKIPIKGILKSELNIILKSVNKLHTACVDKDEQRISTHLREIIANIDQARKRTALEKNQRTHLLKILLAAREHLVMTQNQNGEKRSKSLKGAFGQLVQIVKVFDLDKYRVFFCPKDNSVWLQKSWKAKNPIHPIKFKSCGQLVRS